VGGHEKFNFMDTAAENNFKNISRSKTFKNIIRHFDLDKKSVFDIGCSSGQFLIHFGPKSVGLTIIKDEVEYGKSKGLNVRYGNIESEDFILNQKFDAVFANNIFEHLESPHLFLRKITKYLLPNGILILGVPCIPKIVSLLRFNKFRGSLAIAHINFFTKETLLKTVERAGWKISAIRGFRFANKFIDKLLNPIYPHFYVIAKNDPNFKYSEKRLKEFEGYNKI
jgi:2-polyprenyl-3-methyl-5-hydroxy-6-metoxy-1,4-benzoquinol methylase